MVERQRLVAEHGAAAEASHAILGHAAAALCAAAPELDATTMRAESLRLLSLAGQVRRSAERCADQTRQLIVDSQVFST